MENIEGKEKGKKAPNDKTDWMKLMRTFLPHKRVVLLGRSRSRENNFS